MVKNSLQNEPLVSIVMPSYNSEKFIEKAINSVLCQTYQNWELIIIDDASCDRSFAIAKDYQKNDARIKVYINDENKGVASTRNRGIALSNGDFTAFLDSDDLWRSEKLRIQINKLVNTGADLICSSYGILKGNDEKAYSTYTVPEQITYEGLLKENFIGCSTVIIKTSVIKQFLFSSDFYHEDYVLWLELVRAKHKAVGCSEVLADWRVTSESRSFNKIMAARNRWIIYRKSQKLSLIKSITVFFPYAINGFKKHKRI